MKILVASHPPDATRQILECLGLPTRAPPLAPAVSGLTLQIDSLSGRATTRQGSCAFRDAATT